ncbi:MAG: transposase [Deltaproteobacteria bacterium]|nr:transposase [Deltaproteobacteria bacterium]
MPRKFTKEYKDEAVKLVTEGGLTKQQVAEDLGIGLSTIDKWVQERKESKSESETLTESEKEELKRLRKENSQLRTERDFLKKTANYFAKTVV